MAWSCSRRRRGRARSPGRAGVAREEPLGERRAKAGAAGLWTGPGRTHERLEDGVAAAGGEPRTGVGDLEADGAGFGVDPDPERRPRRGELRRVLDEVRE